MRQHLYYGLNYVNSVYGSQLYGIVIRTQMKKIVMILSPSYVIFGRNKLFNVLNVSQPFDFFAIFSINLRQPRYEERRIVALLNQYTHGYH